MELVEFSEKLAKEYASWEYAAPYDIYNLPSWDTMLQKGYKVTTPEGRKNSYAYKYQNNFVGVVTFKEIQDYIYVGIALSPNSCGKGFGKSVLSRAMEDYDKQHIRKKPFYAEIRSWNERSIKTCQKCGFIIIGKKICKGLSGDFEGVCLKRV